MDAATMGSHRQALVLDSRCPACAERMPAGALFRGKDCPRCGEPATAFELRGHELADRLKRRGRRRLLGLVAVVGVIHLLLGWIPLLGAAVLALSTLWIRLGVLQPATEPLSPCRRILTRSTARLLTGSLLAITIIFCEALTLLGFLGTPIKAIISAAEVAVASAIVTRYVHWQLGREAAGKPVATWEWVVIILATLMLLLLVAALVVAAYFIASAMEGVLGFLGVGG